MSKLFFIGDSITAGSCDAVGGGWVARLSADIFVEGGKAEDEGRCFSCFPLNLSVPGNTVSHLIDRLEAEVGNRLTAWQPDGASQIMFAIGTNDSRYVVDEQRPLFSEEQFKANLVSLITLAKGMTSNISFLGLCPIDDALLNPVPWRPNMAYKNERVGLFESIIQDVCRDNGLAFLQMWEAFMAQENWKDLFVDGLHPNSAGHAFIAQRVKEFLFTDDFFAFHSE